VAKHGIIRLLLQLIYKLQEALATLDEPFAAGGYQGKTL
jgi:hypothetical protein